MRNFWEFTQCWCGGGPFGARRQHLYPIALGVGAVALFYFSLYAQDDDAGDLVYSLRGDPGYSTYAAWPTPPAPSELGLQPPDVNHTAPLSGFSGSDINSGPSTSASGSRSSSTAFFSAPGNTGPLFGAPPSAPTPGAFSVGVSGGNDSAKGYQPTPPQESFSDIWDRLQSQPQLTRPKKNPDVPDWITDNSSKMSSGDYEKAQKLSIERGRLYSDVTENPLGDLAQLLGDMAGTGVSKGPTGQDLPDSIPRGEELHQNRLRIGQVDDQLRQLRDKYDIPPYLYPDSSGSDSKGAQGQFEWKTLSPDKILSNDVLSPLGVGSSTGPVSGAPPSGPDDPGGIDFRSVRLAGLLGYAQVLFRPPSHSIQWKHKAFLSRCYPTRSNGFLHVPVTSGQRFLG